MASDDLLVVNNFTLNMYDCTFVDILIFFISPLKNGANAVACDNYMMWLPVVVK